MQVPYRQWPSLLAALWLTACLSPGSRAADPVLRRLRSDTATFTLNSGFAAASQRVVRNPAEWRATWQELLARERPVGEPPSVDFDREMVVVVALGPQRSGGFGVRILSAELHNGEMLVRARIASPGRGCIVASALTSPADAAVVSPTSGQTRFEIERVVVDCARSD